MTLKFIRRRSSSRSRIHSLARKVEHLKKQKTARRERIIGPREYRRHLLEAHLLEREKEPKPLDIGMMGRKSSIGDKTRALSLIQSQGLDTVSRESIPQAPTILDKEKYLKPIIKMGEIDIPEMEIDLTNADIPIVSFPTLNTKQSTQKEPIHELKTPSKDASTYIIAIPSYNRPELIQVKTLALLHRHEIPASKITIFVANHEQHDLYKSKVPAWLYGNIVVGVLGLRNQWNFIMDYYPEGAHVVQMDDDLDKIIDIERDYLINYFGFKTLEYNNKIIKGSSYNRFLITDDILDWCQKNIYSELNKNFKIHLNGTVVV